MTKKLIPFNLMPASWGLRGKSYKIAEAEYYYEGFELENELLNINSLELKESEVLQKKLDIKKKYNKITDKEYYRELTELITDPIQKELAILELDFKDGKISEIEYDKKSHTIQNKSWHRILKLEFNPKISPEGSFELDWNDLFVKELEEAGYTGHTPDDIVNKWFISICKNVAAEEFGDLNSGGDSDANFEAAKRWSQEPDMGNGKRSYK
jgi:hypothetical protein